MKNLQFIIVICSIAFGVSVSSTVEASVQVGDRIRFTNRVGSTAGGEFGVHRKDNANPFSPGGESAELFRTFCLERNEFIDFNAVDPSGFIIDSISKEAVNGGVGGPNPDPISSGTAWLFYNFTIGTLDDLIAGYSYNDTASANALQEAIWFAEEELTVLPAGLATTLYNTASAANATVALARTFVLNIVWAADRGTAFDGVYEGPSPGSMTDGDPAQSMLYVVPEASTVAVWSILSLMGVIAAYQNRAKSAN